MRVLNVSLESWKPRYYGKSNPIDLELEPLTELKDSWAGSPRAKFQLVQNILINHIYLINQ